MLVIFILKSIQNNSKKLICFYVKHHKTCKINVNSQHLTILLKLKKQFSFQYSNRKK